MTRRLIVERLEDFSFDEAAAVEALLAQTGLRVEMPPGGPGRWDPQETHYFAWAIVLVVPLVAFLTAFGKKLGERAGDDVYDALGAFAQRLWQIKSPGPERSMRGKLIMKDAEVEGRVIELHGEPPEAADIEQARATGFATTNRPATLFWHARSTGPHSFEILASGEPSEDQ